MNENAAVYFVDRHVAEGRTGKTVFREADGLKRSLTYGELAHQSACFAGALNRFGIRREERIAMIVLDQIEFPVVFWGALKLGAIPVPLNTLLSTSVYESILADSRAAVLVVSQALWAVAKPAAQSSTHLRLVLVIGEGDESSIRFADFMSNAPSHDTLQVIGDETAFWLYSSGSTGLPKGVRHVHSSLKATSALYGSGVLGIRTDDVVYSVAKLFFAYGLGNAMTFPMAVGAMSILWSGRPTPDSTKHILAVERPSVFCAVPTHYAALLAAQSGSGTKPEHALRLCLSAGEALPREIGERFEQDFGVGIIDGVGTTEMLHIFLSNTPRDIAYGTSGKPVPGYTVRLVDEHDNDVADGQIGELLVNGPSSAEGYWNRRQKTLSTFMGPWTRTGDKYERRPDGRFVYCGRTDDMFKVSGMWVSPFEVEQALIAFPGILEAAVVARVDDSDLVKPAAFVVLKPDVKSIDIEEVKSFVKDRIGMWKYPRWIDIVSELPKTATGKIQRFKLRAQ